MNNPGPKADIPDWDGPRHDRMHRMATPYLEAAQFVFKLTLDAGRPVTYEPFQGLHVVRWWNV